VSGEIVRRDDVPRRRPAQRGDEAELFEHYGAQLVRIVQRALGVQRQIAEDACSFAWLQLLELQPERDAIVGWLRVVAINEALRLLKGRARNAVFDEGPVEPGPVHVDRRIDLELTVEAREALEHMAALTPQQVRILSLHVAGLTYDEICAATGYSWTQVNRHMGRARSRLRARHKGQDESSPDPADQTTGRRPARGG
jgi:RNA polymerase sigma factor (sigma-70 family)